MVLQEKNLVAHIYNPDNQTKEELIDGFVVRQKKVSTLIQRTFTSQYETCRTTPHDRG
ncbi:MAG: hypothetical protein ACI85O_003118 [Saprospiraceae bacterium]|jgi:hypothetical protein